MSASVFCVGVDIGVGVGGGVGGGINKNVKLYVEGFQILYFLNPQTVLVYIWFDYRCWSKILLSTIHTSAYDLEVKVTNLEILY